MAIFSELPAAGGGEARLAQQALSSAARVVNRNSLQHLTRFTARDMDSRRTKYEDVIDRGEALAVQGRPDSVALVRGDMVGAPPPDRRGARGEEKAWLR
jgi:hypothetical protein